MCQNESWTQHIFQKKQKGLLAFVPSKNYDENQASSLPTKLFEHKKLNLFGFNSFGGGIAQSVRLTADKATEQRVRSPLTIIQRSRVCAPLPPPASRCDSGPVTLFPSPRSAPEQLRRDGDESADKQTQQFLLIVHVKSFVCHRPRFRSVLDGRNLSR